MHSTYHIIEVANTHGGNFDYLLELIDSFADLEKNVGMKFQALHPDKVATSDFPSYNTYKELYFEKDQWKKAIEKAGATKDVWLDIFDAYGVEILGENIELVHGIKFQSSVLYNYEVFQALEKCDLTGKKVILNVAAQSVEDIQKIMANVENKLSPQEILLEFGYQAYPTSLEDSGFSKIPIIKEKFANKLVFADHVDGESDNAIWLPVLAAMSGIDYIEKHVMLESRETKYDHFSSLTPERYKLMRGTVQRYTSIKEMPFINIKEQQYLDKTIMIPLLKKSKPGGSGVCLQEDFIYRRSGQAGLNVKQIEQLQENWNILAVEKREGDVVKRSDFKKATIGNVIACRLKSSRLKKKALLKIGNLPSVEYCISNVLKFDNVNHTVLATSTIEQDEELENYTYNDSVVFFKGDPEDVIQRYLDVASHLKLDVIVRITADNPFMDNEICQILLKEHFKFGADYTTARNAAVGTNLEIINVRALRTIKEHFPNAEYSEYMTWYFQNNPEHFRLHMVDLPKDMVRDYRLTLDHQEDLDVYRKIHNNLEEAGYSNFSVRDIFKYLDEHPEVVSINNDIPIKYRTDNNLIETLNRQTKIK
ncbi:cytidylyltransferase domain-containing protein [Autumnicola musiva]|uniref:N-acetylneuraminate synthase family protein n=1 Tax=Autumnicola musiva TaxID=3075589 RepID=A0ABU3D7G9_9FLAO|nr:N-acetylneuraminate synthase family protein [Zunongwangia sp. F117]MDT0677454.1 N-acetylneuraminate synthase family protein [Zunongwangia sp. F117]